MKEIDFTLPSGKKVRLREWTGLDRLISLRKFIGKPEEEKNEWFIHELISQCIVSLDGFDKPPKGYEELIKLSGKDLSVLILAFTELNTPTADELKEIRGFFPTT